MTINELTLAITNLSDNEKLQLMQIILQQLTDKSTTKPKKDFDPRCYFGVAHYPKPAIDDYLNSMREGWN